MIRKISLSERFTMKKNFSEKTACEIIELTINSIDSLAKAFEGLRDASLVGEGFDFSAFINEAEEEVVIH